MSNDIHPPLGQKPEGDLEPLNKLKSTMDNLFRIIDTATQTIKNLRAENEKLKNALEKLGVKEKEDILVLTKDMEINFWMGQVMDLKKIKGKEFFTIELDLENNNVTLYVNGELRNKIHTIKFYKLNCIKYAGWMKT